MPNPEEPTTDDLLGPSLTPEEEERLTDAERELLRIWNNTQRPEGAKSIGEGEALDARAYQRAYHVDFRTALEIYAFWAAGADVPAPSVVETHVRVYGLESASAGVREVLGSAAAREPAGAGAPSGLSPEALATPVGQAIAAVTDDPTVQAAMWAGAGLEGSQEGPWGTGPGGAYVGGAGEVGPWQIHPVHFEQITPEAAADPNSAALYMLPRYEDAVKSVPAELWETDPNAALALAIANAERPAGWHEGLTAEEAVAIYGGGARVGGAAGPTTIQGVLAEGIPGAEAPARALTDEEYAEWSELNTLYGIPQHAYLSAKIQGVEGEEAIVRHWLELQQEADIIALKESLTPLLDQMGVEWSDEEWAEAVRLGLTEAHLRAAAQAHQTPRQWWDEQEAQLDEMLKGLGLTREDWARAQQYGIPLNDYQVMLELGMEPQQWNQALDRLGTADAIWQAAQLGYDPATMNPAQIARYELRTDVGLQIMRATEAIPEAVRPDISALSPAITNRYDLRRAEARTEGRYLSPGDFLGEEYPGLFGGGTAQQLRADLEGIMGEVETQRPLTRAERLAHPARARISPLGATMGAGLTRRGAGIQLPYFGGRPGTRYGPEEQILREMPTRGLTPAGEMLYQRGLAQAMIEAPGHRQPADIERIRARYPELARRAEAGEHETEEEKRRRRLKGRLQPAGRSTGRAGYTPPQVVNFPR